MSGPRPEPPWPELPPHRFGAIAGRIIFQPGPVRPDWFTPAALRAMPGRKIRWAIGTGPKRARAIACALRNTEAGDAIVITDDLEEADRWYFAWLDAEGLPKPWLRRAPRHRGLEQIKRDARGR